MCAADGEFSSFLRILLIALLMWFGSAVPCRGGSGGAYDAASVGREVLCYAAI
jgi:hypothetical protein